MNLLHWFKSKSEMAPINPVVAVHCHVDVLAFRWEGGVTESVNLDDIQLVAVRTTDQGPFDEDVFFMLEVNNNTYLIPQEAEGTTQLLECLQQLPGFDNEALINSMCCMDNKVFLCWERVADQSD